MSLQPPAGPLVGIIGGSGLYEMAGLVNTEWVRVESTFGEPSDDLLFGEIDGHRVVFLPRHGRGHRLPPTAINFRANIDALKRAGVTDVLSFSAVGSLREDLAPGAFVIVDQFIDRTFARAKTFFGAGLAAHVSMSRPVCARLGDAVEAAARGAGLPVTRGGTYITMEGPQFSTLAESLLYRSWGCDVIGMTSATEAKLCREAEICYATINLVTDYDVWRESEEPVSVGMILENVVENISSAKALLKEVIPQLSRGADEACACSSALKGCIVTNPDVIPREAREKLRHILEKYPGQ